MRRALLLVALLLALSIPASGHTYLAHSACILHTTYYFDVRDSTGVYWYHKSLDAGDRVEAWHYSRYPGDPYRYRHSSYGCWS